MSAAIAIAAGTVLLVVMFVDLVWTTLGVSYGSGPLTRVVLGLGWRAASPLRRRRAHGWQAAAGVTTVLATLALWVVLLWAAWSLILLGPSRGIVDGASAAAGGWDRVYFAGYSLFTLGNGEFRPEGALWQMLTVLTALSGLTVVSLAIAYLVLVASAAAERHAVAVQISLLGSTPAEVAKAWATATDTAQFEALVHSLAAPIVELTQRHLTYPVLHFFHGPEPKSSPPVAIAILDDALTMLLLGVAPPARPSGPGIQAVRRSIDDYLAMVAHNYGDDTHEPQPMALDTLAATGVPVVDQREFDAAVEELTPRRRALYRLAAAEGFSTQLDG